MFEVLMGVEASLTLGREEKPWVKGLVGLYIVVKKIHLMMRSYSFIHGVWAPFKPYSLVFWRYKCMCKKEKNL